MKTTLIVDNMLSMQEEKLKLAKENKLGVQVMFIEQFFERLAGGFLKTINYMQTQKVINKNVEKVELKEIKNISKLPGFSKATANTLFKVWLSDINKDDYKENSRFNDLMNISNELEKSLFPNIKLPKTIVELCNNNLDNIKNIFGDITFKNMTEIAPLWKNAILKIVTYNKSKKNDINFYWDSCHYKKPDWVNLENGFIVKDNIFKKTNNIKTYSFATPREEISNVIRWAKELLSKGVLPNEIAICSSMPNLYDSILFSIIENAELKIHFANGISIINSENGQEIASLIDILLRGVSQKKLKRLINLMKNDNNLLIKDLPENWEDNIPYEASLTTFERWDNILKNKKNLDLNLKNILENILQILRSYENNQTDDILLQIGEKILNEESFKIWKDALEIGNLESTEQYLSNLKVFDREDPTTSIVWGSADYIACSNRKYVWLVGLVSKVWPRLKSEDRLLPNHIIEYSKLNYYPEYEKDKNNYQTFYNTTQEELNVSWYRKSEDGKIAMVSPLINKNQLKNHQDVLSNRKIFMPYSIQDYYTEQTEEFKLNEKYKNSHKKWESIWTNNLTEYDGIIDKNHPRIMQILEETQSSSSIVLLLRNPIGFMWKYGLGMNSPEYIDDPLILNSKDYGKFIHLALSNTVKICNNEIEEDELELKNLVNNAVKMSARYAERLSPVPPNVIWNAICNNVQDLVFSTLTTNLIPRMNNQKTLTELKFGTQNFYKESNKYNIDTEIEIQIPNTNIKVKGIIDRIDFNDNEVRIIDYKTSNKMKSFDNNTTNHGKEIQRIIYHEIAKKSFKNIDKIETALYFINQNKYLPLEDSENVLQQLSEQINLSIENILDGNTIPGPDTLEEYNEFMFAFPSNATKLYFKIKQNDIMEKTMNLDIWS